MSLATLQEGMWSPSVVPLPEQIERQLGSVTDAVREGDFHHARVLLNAIIKYVAKQ